MSRWNYYRFYEPARPREARGGIKAQSKRAKFGESWWAKRWITVLESFNIGARLGRDRSYARRGQVLSVDIDKGTVSAEVQGSRRRPYSVKIKIKPFSKIGWKKLAKSISSKAVFTAKLLAWEMPQDIEKAFQEAGVSLFPSRLNDLKTDCSCPDWSNPCKHIAAVYYLLGEEFDRDPFLIFKLRGIGREELVELLGDVKRALKKSQRRPAAKDKKEEKILPPEPLPAEETAFWGEGSLTEDLLGEVHIPPVNGALPKRLGSFSFWRSEEKFMDAMEQIYGSVSQLGLKVFLGEIGVDTSEMKD